MESFEKSVLKLLFIDNQYLSNFAFTDAFEQCPPTISD